MLIICNYTYSPSRSPLMIALPWGIRSLVLLLLRNAFRGKMLLNFNSFGVSKRRSWKCFSVSSGASFQLLSGMATGEDPFQHASAAPRVRRHQLVQLQSELILPSWLVVFAEKVEARIRHRHSILVRVDRAERKIFSRRGWLGQNVEEGRLADVWHSNNSHLQVRTDSTDERLLLWFNFLWRHFLLKIDKSGWPKMSWGEVDEAIIVECCSDDSRTEPRNLLMFTFVQCVNVFLEKPIRRPFSLSTTHPQPSSWCHRWISLISPETNQCSAVVNWEILISLLVDTDKAS